MSGIGPKSWRLLTNPEARAAWIFGGRRVPFVEVTCPCGRVGIYRSKTFQRVGVVVVVCQCGCAWRVAK